MCHARLIILRRFNFIPKGFMYIIASAKMPLWHEFHKEAVFKMVGRETRATTIARQGLPLRGHGDESDSNYEVVS